MLFSFLRLNSRFTCSTFDNYILGLRALEGFDNVGHAVRLLKETPMNVNVKEISVPYEFKLPSGRVLFRVEEVRLSYEQFDGSMGSDVTRVNFERGDAVGALLYEEETGKVILVEQFRYPVYARDAQKGWMLEIVAGIKDDEGRVVARREILEETGLEPTSPLEHLTDFYVSPGGTSERVELYLARVQETGSLQENTGIAAESEDTRTHAIPLAEALQMVEDGRIEDGKTILALLMLKQLLD